MKLKRIKRRRKVLAGIIAALSVLVVLIIVIFIPRGDEENIQVETAIREIELELSRPEEDRDIQRIVDLIVFLGDERDGQASSILVETIGIRVPEIDRPISRYLVEEIYPSIAALIKIGKPTVPYILDGIDAATDDTQIRVLAYTLAKIIPPKSAKDHVGLLGSSNATRALEWLQLIYPP